MASRILLLALAGAALWPSPAAAAAAGAHPATPEQVEISDGGVTLHATLYRPEGAGPFPAVVALHDCSGLDPRRRSATRQYAEWANLLVAHSFAVLFPDSYGSRGLDSQCRVHDRKVRVFGERVADANAARRWLQGQSFIRSDRVSLLGWGNGGATALWTVNTARREGGDFRSAVAFYPGCRRLRETAWSARVPTLILIGSADDWTPASTCQQMVAGARGRSAHVAIIVYPGAHHDFDRSNYPERLRTGLAFTADPAGKAHGGTHPAARTDALRRVPQWLAR